MHCTFRCFLVVINVMRHFSMYALWQDIFKLVIAFTHCAMISFHCVVNNDPGVDKYTQEGLEVNSGFSHPPTSTPTPYIPSRGEKIKEKVSSRFTTRSRRHALISPGRADLESVWGSGEGDSLPSSSSTILHHQFHDAHRRA